MYGNNGKFNFVFMSYYAIHVEILNIPVFNNRWCQVALE